MIEMKRATTATTINAIAAGFGLELVLRDWEGLTGALILKFWAINNV